MGKNIFLISVLCLITLFVITCSEDDSVNSDIQILKSEKERIVTPSISDSDFTSFVNDNNAFALDLYNLYASGGKNIFYSPYSISIAIAMTYGGANGDTKSQIANTMHFTLEEKLLHSAFNKLDLSLNSANNNTEEGEFVLNIINATWGEKTFKFIDSYLDILAVNYGAGLNLLDFIGNPDRERKRINDWVNKQTNGKINDLLADGSITIYTRLVLTNAIYFYADWLNQFDVNNSQRGVFNLLDNSTTFVTMMRKDSSYNYFDGEDYKAVELPYKGNRVSMQIIVPDKGKFKDFEALITNDKLNEINSSLVSTGLDLRIPKFEFEAEYGLKNDFISLGMIDAFSVSDADFSGMDGTKNLYIDKVIHKSYIKVDEEGTEAAAATGVTITLESAIISDSLVFEIDRPFIFIIKDNESGSILFMGRVLNLAN